MLSDQSILIWQILTGRCFGYRYEHHREISYQILGALLVYAPHIDAFGEDETILFRRLGDELAFAMSLEEDRVRLDQSRAAQRAAQDAELEALRKLKESEEHFRVLAENSLDLVLRYDLN
ncbi:MAG: hypothetical protein VW711_16220, partial [Verrucomicrobiales bacterium]